MMYDYTHYVKDVRELLRNIDPGTVGGRAQDLYFQLRHVTEIVLKQLDAERLLVIPLHEIRIEVDKDVAHRRTMYSARWRHLFAQADVLDSDLRTSKVDQDALIRERLCLEINEKWRKEGGGYDKEFTRVDPSTSTGTEVYSHGVDAATYTTAAVSSAKW